MKPRKLGRPSSTQLFASSFGVKTTQNHISYWNRRFFGYLFPENCMKMKFWAIGGARPSRPQDPPLLRKSVCKIRTAIKPFTDVTCITRVKLEYSTTILTSTQCQGLSEHVYQIQYGLYPLYGCFQVPALMSAYQSRKPIRIRIRN